MISQSTQKSYSLKSIRITRPDGLELEEALKATYLSPAEIDRRLDGLVETILKEITPVLEDLEDQGCLDSRWRLKTAFFFNSTVWLFAVGIALRYCHIQSMDLPEVNGLWFGDIYGRLAQSHNVEEDDFVAISEEFAGKFTDATSAWALDQFNEKPERRAFYQVCYGYDRWIAREDLSQKKGGPFNAKSMAEITRAFKRLEQNCMVIFAPGYERKPVLKEGTVQANNSDQIFMAMSKSLDTIIDSAGKELWPVLNKLISAGEINGDKRCEVQARLFLCATSTFFANALGAFHFEISSDKFFMQIQSYVDRYMRGVANTYEIEDISSVVKIYEGIEKTLRPALVNCIQGFSKSREEGDRQLLILAIIFAGMLSSDRNRYGAGRPFSDSVIGELFGVIKKMMTHIIDDFMPDLKSLMQHQEPKQSTVQPQLPKIDYRKAFSLLWKNVLAVIMLAVAMNDIDEEGYYTLLRIVIFLLSLWTAYRWHTLGKAVLLWLFVGLAILFNPVIPVHFDKDIWQGIDFIALVAFVADGYFQVKLTGCKH